MAKFCTKCGGKLNPNEKFCTACGARVDSAPASPPPRPADVTRKSEPKPATQVVLPPQEPLASSESEHTSDKKPGRKKLSKGKKALIILISVAVVLVGLAITGLVLYFSGPARDVVQEMDAQDYTSAVAIYESEVQNDFLQRNILKAALNDYSEEVMDRFKNGELEYTAACAALNSLAQMGFGDMSAELTELAAIYDANVAFEKGEQYYSEGDYESAIREYTKITESSENYEAAQTKLQELYPQYIAYVTEQAGALAAAGDYEQALELVNTALSLVPAETDTSALTAIRDENLNNYKSQVMSTVTDLINNQQFEEALDTIHYAVSVDNNADFQNTQATVEQAYVDHVTASVQAYLSSEDYVSAARVASNALTVLPGNAALEALKAEVDSVTPVYLLDVCKPYETNRYEEFINGETFQMGGTAYTNGFTLETSNSGHAYFNLNGNYASVSFDLGHVDGSGMNTSTVKIYCDEILKAEYEIAGGSLPQRISLDTTGVSQLKIIVENFYAASYGFGNIIVK